MMRFEDRSWERAQSVGILGQSSLKEVNLMSRNVQYVTDERGERTAVIVPIEEYEELLEDLHVTRVAEETRDEERIPWAQVKAELVSEGKLDADI
jgi:hypothetical protein